MGLDYGLDYIENAGRWLEERNKNMSGKINDEMMWKEVIKLFRKSNEVHQWGEYAHIKLYDDGSGDVVTDGDYDIIFSFYDLRDLVEKLRGL